MGKLYHRYGGIVLQMPVPGGF